MSVLPIREVRATIVERITRTPLGHPISLNIGMDEEWSPRIQGEVVIPDRLDLSAWDLGGGLWKLQGDVLTLELETRFGSGLTVADLTAAYGGTVAAVTAAHGGSVRAVTEAHTRPWHPGELLQPLSAATALWGGSVAAVTADHAGRVAEITRRLRVPGGTHLISPTEQLRLVLRIREQTPDELDGTITIQVASEDVRLHDYRHTATSVLQSLHTSLRPLVAEVLQRIGQNAGPQHRIELAPGPDLTITAGQEWKPGQTAWEFLHPILEAAGWSLYADAAGLYRLEPRTTTVAPDTLHVELNLIDYRPRTDLRDGWYEGAIVEYTDADPEIPTQRYDVYLMPGAQRIMHETRPGVRTMPGAAEQLVTRSRTRSTIGDAEAVTMLRLRPGQRAPIRSPLRADHGTIRALTHRLPDAETTIRFRDIIPD